MAALTGKGRKTRHVPLRCQHDGTAGRLPRRTASLPPRALRIIQCSSTGTTPNSAAVGLAWILHKYQARAADRPLTNAHLSPHGCGIT